MRVLRTVIAILTYLFTWWHSVILINYKYSHSGIKSAWIANYRVRGRNSLSKSVAPKSILSSPIAVPKWSHGPKKSIKITTCWIAYCRPNPTTFAKSKPSSEASSRTSWVWEMSKVSWLKCKRISWYCYVWRVELTFLKCNLMSCSRFRSIERHWLRYWGFLASRFVKRLVSWTSISNRLSRWFRTSCLLPKYTSFRNNLLRWLKSYSAATALLLSWCELRRKR